jgi:putative photosynthetic complex assembly protein 2
MQALIYLLPVLYVLFLWWFITGLIMAVYDRSRRVVEWFFTALTVVMFGAFAGIFFTRDVTQSLDVYVAVTCGVLIWGWQVAAYYLGFVSGPEQTEIPQRVQRGESWHLNLADRFRLALHSSLNHELLVLGFAVFMLGLTWFHTNRWSLWIYVTLWLMHSSAKLNVFLGVRNFHIDFLPEKLHYLDALLTKRESNALFPVSVVLASSTALVLLYQAIEPGTSPTQTVGFLAVATMIILGLIEHWLMILPIPSALVGWGMRPIPEQTPQGGPRPGNETEDAAPPRPRVDGLLVTAYMPDSSAEAAEIVIEPTKRKYTFNFDDGPVVADVWEPGQPTDELPILLIHGWGGTGSYWNETAEHLAAFAKVIVPDLPGTGRSQPIKRTHNMADQVETLATMMDSLNIDRYRIIGHSMGATMGILLANQHSQRVERIVLTSVAFFMTENQERIYKAIMGIYRFSFGFRPKWLADVPGLKQLLAAQYFYRLPDDEQILKSGLLAYLHLDADTAMACARDAIDPAIPEAGAQVQAPTLLVVCHQDKVMPLENVNYTAEIIPNCEVHWIEKCGHFPMVERFDLYSKIVRDFFELA